jgi:predicted phage terminase large subunit-like protein
MTRIEDASDLEEIRQMLQAAIKLPEAFVPQKPTPHQALFQAAPQKEVFFGGSAGPGKSSGLLMAALQYVEHSAYRALIIRKTFADLDKPGALIPRSHEWLQGTGAHWNQQKHTWTFPSGATLTFGHMEHENDKYKYQGTEFHFIGFDELTHMTETKYLYLLSRLRAPKGMKGSTDIPLRLRATGNPGGEGHEWVKNRFVTLLDQEELEELGWDEEEIEEEMKSRSKRLYIPATLKDNPHLDYEEYSQQLRQLDSVTRAQLLNGDWEILPGGNLFRREFWDGRIHKELPRGVEFIRKVRYWDLASTDEEKCIKDKGEADYTASCLMALGDDGQCYVLEMTRDRLNPAAVERLVRTKAERDKSDGMNTIIWMEQEPGSSGVNTINFYGRYVLLGFPFFGDKPTGSKIERARPASSASELGFIHLIQGSWTQKFLNEASGFPLVTHDDMVDAFTGAFSKISSGAMIGRDYRKIKERNKHRKKKGLWD